MKPENERRTSGAATLAAIVFDLLNPVAFGFFVGALIFDVTYANTADILWMKFAAWLITIGLLFAIVPRLINLFQVWWPGPYKSAPYTRAAFWLNFVAIAAAIVNAFVHSRDAYASVPEGVWLSIATVLLMVIASVLVTLDNFRYHGVEQA